MTVSEEREKRIWRGGRRLATAFKVGKGRRGIVLTAEEVTNGAARLIGRYRLATAASGMGRVGAAVALRRWGGAGRGRLVLAILIVLRSLASGRMRRLQRPTVGSVRRSILLRRGLMPLRVS